MYLWLKTLEQKRTWSWPGCWCWCSEQCFCLNLNHCSFIFELTKYSITKEALEEITAALLWLYIVLYLQRSVDIHVYSPSISLVNPWQKGNVCKNAVHCFQLSIKYKTQNSTEIGQRWTCLALLPLSANAALVSGLNNHRPIDWMNHLQHQIFPGLATSTPQGYDLSLLLYTLMPETKLKLLNPNLLDDTTVVKLISSKR